MTQFRNCHVLVLGNEKGGSGKSTTAMHLLMALCKSGINAAALDLDGRQRTLSRYLENRVRYAEKAGLSLHQPQVITLQDSQAAATADAAAEDKANLEAAYRQLAASHDAIVIDTPGRFSALSQAAHGLADTLITPLNDSFIDLDLLAQVDPDSNKVLRPSFYSELVWQARKARQMRDRGTVDWVVLRTRLSSLEAKNKRKVGAAIDELAKRIGFRVLPGLSERVIYRELFLKGLTLLDLKDGVGEALTLSHVAARQELRDLMSALKLPTAKLDEAA
jgi:chromosome partitioning protein